MKPYIFTGFSPNTRGKDVFLSLSLVAGLWLSRFSKKFVLRLEGWFREYFSVSHAYAFDSGRSALTKILAAAGIGAGDEVIIQAFTCVVVPNSITRLGAVPVYADCTERYVIDTDDFRKKITPKTRAVVLQHTFGEPTDMDSIIPIARSHNLVIIEDCAHSLGMEYKGKLLGTIGDVAIFSFGSDKVISGVRGGMAITNDDSIGKRLADEQHCLPGLSLMRELQHLLHPLFFWIGKNTYHLFAGKAILFLANKLNIINKIIYKQEKEGSAIAWFPARLPNSLALLAFCQIKNLDAWNIARRNVVDFYMNRLNGKTSIKKIGTQNMLLRFPIEVSDPSAVRRKAKEKHIILGDWYVCPVAPCGSSASGSGYISGSCPTAERLGKSVVNLPTGPNLSDSEKERICSLFGL